MCDHPGATRQDYLNHLRSIIGTVGWVVQTVEGDGVRAPYAYTVGLTAHGKPELVITGMAAYQAVKLLNDFAAHMLHGSVPAPGEQVPLIGGQLTEIVEVERPPVHLGVAVEFYGSRIRALQIVHADDRGHWPWELRYRGGRGGQPVLGNRAGISRAS
jgi:hypothetical protein